MDDFMEDPFAEEVSPMCLSGPWWLALRLQQQVLQQVQHSHRPLERA